MPATLTVHLSRPKIDTEAAGELDQLLAALAARGWSTLGLPQYLPGPPPTFAVKISHPEAHDEDTLMWALKGLQALQVEAGYKVTRFLYESPLLLPQQPKPKQSAQPGRFTLGSAR